ncbi:hypothetical protein ACJJIW_10460 [Microbulbifer sp. JMSA004]|uniref:hypothetical protein n=1 Tax=unclassified Microbulbifer TaxID=2619833 RepID=UPI004039A845
MKISSFLTDSLALTISSAAIAENNFVTSQQGGAFLSTAVTQNGSTMYPYGSEKFDDINPDWLLSF